MSPSPYRQTTGRAPARRQRTTGTSTDTSVRRVLFLASSAWLGGANRFLITTGKELLHRGIASGIVFLSNGPAIAAARRAGMEVSTCPIQPPDLARPLPSAIGLVRTLRLLRRATPDVVHANDVDAARALAVACRRTRVPLVCHVHKPEPLTDREIEWAFRRLPKPQVIIDVDRGHHDLNARVLRRVLPTVRHALLYNGIDLAEFTQGAKPRSGARRVGCVANLLRVKRHEDFLDMAARLAGRHPDVEFWMIGDGSIDPNG